MSGRTIRARPGAPTYTYYARPTTRPTPASPGHPATVQVREDTLLALIAREFATQIFGPDRATLLAAQIPATPADTARKDKQAAKLRQRLRQIDTIEDAHIREIQTLAGLDPHAPAVAAMRSRHLARFTELEDERAQINTRSPSPPAPPTPSPPSSTTANPYHQPGNVPFSTAR